MRRQLVFHFAGDADQLRHQRHLATHIAGTFSFDAPPIPGTSTTGTLHVTSGAFDLSY
jgi:hypothetical protein